MQRATHEVQTSDEIPIAFDLYQEPGRENVLIICPGFCQSKETKTFQGISTAFAQQLDVVCMDFRGHGRSGGVFSFLSREMEDLAAVLKWVQPIYRRIGVMGFSLGGATAINCVGHLGGIQTLIAVSSPSAFEEIEFRFWTPEALQTGLRGLEPGAGCRPGSPLMKKERPIDNIKKVAPVPILLIHGTNDQVVSHRHSERLHAAAGTPKRLGLIEGGGHAEELFFHSGEDFLPLVQEGLKPLWDG